MVDVLVIFAAIYLGHLLLFYLFQHFFFFRPEILPSHFSYEYPFEFVEKTFEMEDGGIINSVLFKVPNSRGVVYYFKGNSRSIKGWAKFSKDFISNGYDFFMMDYRGFGKSSGKRTETKLYNDSQQIYKWLASQYPEEKIVVYGRSLGSGIATRIASWNNPRLLILDSPYYSFFHYIKTWAPWMPLKLLLRYHIRTDQFIKQVNSHVHILHGDRDRLISIRNSERLRDLSPEQVILHSIIGAGHNNLTDFPAYHEILYELLDYKVIANYQTSPDAAADL